MYAPESTAALEHVDEVLNQFSRKDSFAIRRVLEEADIRPDPRAGIVIESMSKVVEATKQKLAVSDDVRAAAAFSVVDMQYIYNKAREEEIKLLPQDVAVMIKSLTAIARMGLTPTDIAAAKDMYESLKDLYDGPNSKSKSILFQRNCDAQMERKAAQAYGAAYIVADIYHEMKVLESSFPDPKTRPEEITSSIDEFHKKMEKYKQIAMDLSDDMSLFKLAALERTRSRLFDECQDIQKRMERNQGSILFKWSENKEQQYKEKLTSKLLALTELNSEVQQRLLARDQKLSTPMDPSFVQNIDDTKSTEAWAMKTLLDLGIKEKDINEAKNKGIANANVKEETVSAHKIERTMGQPSVELGEEAMRVMIKGQPIVLYQTFYTNDLYDNMGYVLASKGDPGPLVDRSARVEGYASPNVVICNGGFVGRDSYIEGPGIIMDGASFTDRTKATGPFVIAGNVRIEDNAVIDGKGSVIVLAGDTTINRWASIDGKGTQIKDQTSIEELIMIAATFEKNESIKRQIGLIQDCSFGDFSVTKVDSNTVMAKTQTKDFGYIELSNGDSVANSINQGIIKNKEVSQPLQVTDAYLGDLSIVENLADWRTVQLGHAACTVSKGNDEYRQFVICFDNGSTCDISDDHKYVIVQGKRLQNNDIINNGITISQKEISLVENILQQLVNLQKEMTKKQDVDVAPKAVSFMETQWYQERETYRKGILFNKNRENNNDLNNNAVIHEGIDYTEQNIEPEIKSITYRKGILFNKNYELQSPTIEMMGL